MVVHNCNSTYSEGGDQEDHGLRPIQEKVKDSDLKKWAGCGVYNSSVGGLQSLAGLYKKCETLFEK
jgi:hypothetical protein